MKITKEELRGILFCKTFRSESQLELGNPIGVAMTWEDNGYIWWTVLADGKGGRFYRFYDFVDGDRGEKLFECMKWYERVEKEWNQSEEPSVVTT